MKYLLAILILCSCTKQQLMEVKKEIDGGRLYFGWPKGDMFLGDNHSALSWNKNNSIVIGGDAPKDARDSPYSMAICLEYMDTPLRVISPEFLSSIDTMPVRNKSNSVNIGEVYNEYLQINEERIEFKDTTHYRQISFTFIDSCQRFRDSIAKYQFNINVWKRRISPLNDPGYNILLNDKIKSLEATKKKFYQLFKKCK